MTEPDDLRSVSTPWPALVALGVVVVLSLAMFALDLVVDHHTADHTSALVENSLRSVALADDLRHQAYRLSVANLTPDQIASIAEQIDADARAYDPLANSDGEADEWNRLQALFAQSAIGDMITRIRNAQLRRRGSVATPGSKMRARVAARRISLRTRTSSSASSSFRCSLSLIADAIIVMRN